MKKLILGVLAVAIIGFGVWVSRSQSTLSGGVHPLAGPITMTELAKHNSQTSCYTVIDGSVYDLTDWIGQHPGGEGAILSICGVDGTSAFMNQHSGNQRPQSILATYKIGTLAR